MTVHELDGLRPPRAPASVARSGDLLVGDALTGRDEASRGVGQRLAEPVGLIKPRRCTSVAAPLASLAERRHETRVPSPEAIYRLPIVTNDPEAGTVTVLKARFGQRTAQTALERSLRPATRQ